jgi:hypothetical protein
MHTARTDGRRPQGRSSAKPNVPVGRLRYAVAKLLRLSAAAALFAGLTMPAAVAGDGHLRFAPGDIVWQDGPASLPPGAQVVVLEGDPAAAGPLTLRLKFPPGYQVPPHTHPAIEHVTVLERSFGLGSVGDAAGGEELGVGGYVIVPVGHPHHAWTSEGTVIQLHSVGPWGITYLDPRDDPRNK